MKYVISKEQGKILKVFVCDSIICQLDLEHKVHSMKNVHTTKVKFRETVKKFAKPSDLSGNLESPITISLSNILFSPITISILMSTCLFL